MIGYINKVEVKKSGIEGKGVFAATDIKSGEVILDMNDIHVVENLDTLIQVYNY